MRLFHLFIFAGIVGCAACQTPEVSQPPPQLTKDQKLRANLDSLKSESQNGDLVVRLTDDIISSQVSQLNETDKSFSHAGIIKEKEGKKFVYDIGPNLPGADTIELTPIDSFLSPEKNIRCALFRYSLSSDERAALINKIESYKKADTRFDIVYDLKTDDKLYCSEMIFKSLKAATGNRITVAEYSLPARYQKMMVTYFKKQGLTKEIIAHRKYIPLDHLYLLPGCKELMRFDLKIFPGQ